MKQGTLGRDLRFYTAYVNIRFNDPEDAFFEHWIDGVELSIWTEEKMYIISKKWLDENYIDIFNFSKNEEMLIKLNFDPYVWG